ncbi:cytochrome P450 [Schizophyllum commune H4-8]|uniref:cytochrome P450 n=1 Tax=Schizophyllum commune (strain H4-8 / FGSC 9210) TaxID=578458 RepID=UPI002160215D|nr:cytochrome P450 [Schizophyllum commune H4-8]KAI5888148.1 cytochrome P450 [Schizophyllum commune H4-8]
MSFANSSFAPLAVLVGIVAYLYSRRRRDALPLPPGPRKLPLVGNLFDMPKRFEWEKYMDWAKEFDTDILHLDVAEKSIVVLDSYEAAVELLEKRSKMYSDRPPFPMTIDLMGMDFNFAFVPYGDKWRARRRLLHGFLHATASVDYQPLELKGAHAFLRAMLNAGEDDLEAELRHMTGRLILRIVYGLDIQKKDDPHVTNAEALLRMLTTSSIQGSYLVNSVPALKCMPEWVPGADFKRVARLWRRLGNEIVDRPFHEVQESMTSGASPTPSFALNSIEKGADESVIRDAAATMYNGGTDTTVVTLLNFTLAMLDHPEMQRRAQAELDTVLGPLQTSEGAPGQMPALEHESRLPYITALVRESSRYKPVTPVSITHAYSGAEVDIYNGYAIPSGSIIIPNVWSMMHNEITYPDPYAFKPERFLSADGKLDPQVRDPGTMAFGFGRRVCLGRHLAYNSVWIMIASILRVYNIEKAKDADGKPIEPHREWASALVQNPEHLKCVLSPRNAGAAEMIRATEGMEY